MEYTLDDAFQTLKDIQSERTKEIEDLIDTLSENSPVSFKRNSNLEEIRKKQHKCCKHLLNQVFEEKPKDFPILKTSDLHVEVLKELEEEVQTAKKFLESLQEYQSFIEDDISYLENKKIGLEKMKQAYLEHSEMIDNTSYTRENVLLKQIFNSVKKDLQTVVSTIFPDNKTITDFLAKLTTSYLSGGDDVYVDILPEQELHFTNFLIEADIIMHHRNDKNKVRLMDML
ncbi:uncharacterized protein LOC122400977 [Colletes gigas]|uniref:uncharacterized protein LOC122400977 n=1 Tax=Colletes gigas TaxID=935657 RepID=UPI001C9B4CFA|nr:uncharacterized protein LOC122400977 [Colletes gigas]XP_043258728.1 uncharacterized protein LOC122400977 [Colletes gigas]